MSYRTTPELVMGIIEVLDGVDLNPFIATANELVTEMCVPAGYNSTRLELIERWLAAHFYAIFDPRAVSETAGISASYESKVDFGFALTRYGQQAMRLDTKAALSVLDKQATTGDGSYIPKIMYLGTRPRNYRC